MNYRSQRSMWLWVSVGLTILSGIMVLMFRSEEIASHFKGTLLEALLLIVHTPSMQPMVNSLPVWIVYSLPNAMLLAAVLCVFGFLVRGCLKLVCKLVLATLPMLVFSTEIMQLTGHMPGTFDLFDMVCYFFATIVPISLFVNKEQEQKMARVGSRVRR